MNTPFDWSATQKHVAFASFSSWMLDAFDFFILVLSLIHISEPTRHFKRSRMPSSA